jgi:hypothetical protein
MANQGLFAAMVDRNIKFCLGDVGVAQLILFFMRLRRSRTTFLHFKEVLIAGIPFREIEKIWELVVFLILNGCYRISNLRYGIYNKIINGCNKSFVFILRLSFLRRLSSWDLIYCGNLTNRIKIGMSVLAKLIYFFV